MSTLPAKRLPQVLFSPASGDVEVEPASGECNAGEEIGESLDGHTHWKCLLLCAETGRNGSGGEMDDCADSLTYWGHVCDDASAAPGRGGKGEDKDDCLGGWA